MKKNMLLVILITTFFSCTEILDELELDLDSESIVDSLSNSLKPDTVYIQDTVYIEGEDTTTVIEEPALLQTSLFSTNAEIEIWKDRMQNGPFKSTNDFGINSPGDFERILKNANDFLRDPSADRITWSSSGPADSETEKNRIRRAHANLRDAAFVYLITQDEKYANAVKKELLSQVRESSTDFGKSSVISAKENLDGSPYFDMANWLNRLVYSYDMVENNFSASEKTEMKNWFLTAAKVYQEHQDNVRSIKLWPNRNVGDYTPSSTAKEPSVYTHDGGYQNLRGNGWYNNRQAVAVMFYGIAGIKFNNSTLASSAKRWFKEWLKFGIYPSGLTSEFSRSNSSRPEAGYDYSSITADCMLSLADAFARKGDFELYDYQTSEGIGESKGGNKSLLLVLQTLSKLITDQYFDQKTQSKYIYSGSSHNNSTKIDGRDDDNIFARPIWFAHANLYYQDQTIKSAYTQLMNESFRYSSMGGVSPFCGAWGIMPAKLFMYGDLEGKINPYPFGSSK